MVKHFSCNPDFVTDFEIGRMRTSLPRYRGKGSAGSTRYPEDEKDE
jgi:hypothetical protein